MAYHICIRILFPSTTIVFILKSIPRKYKKMQNHSLIQQITGISVTTCWIILAMEDFSPTDFFQLTYGWYVWSVKFVVGEATENTSFSNPWISNQENFKQVVITFRHISFTQLQGSQPSQLKQRPTANYAWQLHIKYSWYKQLTSQLPFRNFMK